ncbi:hypothetical protein C9J48_17755 [Photobacterium profundum]|uniref:Selenocysteine synthase n=1 Tax=Photobacterium profundum 3TCK TaxID=314280 RepID=Q1Z860_9GAMM|nr:hypothetical protein [Photobacterium profundum]EAS44653.1 selenocysteine synthase [Photobacterium profundum 3TCK]PSV60645.1 hypothetical protein C9J48_17755 [Photobacterium profundum]
MGKLVIKTLSVSKLELLPSSLRDEVHVDRLMSAFRVSPTLFFERLLDAITPVPVMTFNRHYYPVRYLAELAVLTQYHPDEQLSVVVKGKAQSLQQIQQHSASTQWIDLLHSHRSMDLGRLDSEWEQAFDYQPILSKTELSLLLNCDRSSLYKHPQKLRPRCQPSRDEMWPEPPSKVDFSTSTNNIPDK